MNSTTKAVIASAVVIALCLCVVGGTTYSWFSDTEQADIDITAGTIELDLSEGSVYVQSYGGQPKELTSGTAVTTDLGGSVTYTTGSTDSSFMMSVVFTNAAPGDSVTFTVDGNLTNTINVYYSEVATVTMPQGSDLESPFTITGLSDASVLYPASANGSTISRTTPVSIVFDQNAGNEYKGLVMAVDIVFEAVQANAPSSSSSASVSVGAGNNIIGVAGDGTMSSASVSFTSGTATGEILTVTSLSQQSADSYTISSGAILGGVEVTSSNGGDALKGTAVTVSMVLAGDLSDADNTPLTFYHGSTQFTPTDGYTATYDSASDTTTVVFQTSDGFSPYFVTAAVEARVGGIYYSTIEDAIDASSGDEGIQVLVDVTLDSDLSIPIELVIPEGFDVTVDLNGHSITSQKHALKVFGSLTLNGDGLVMAGSHDGDLTAGNEYVTLFANGGTITTNGGKYISQDKAEVVYVHNYGQVIINDGMFGSLSTETDWGNVLNVSNGKATVDCIVVRGGTFANYDPASGDDNLRGSFLADGYVTIYSSMTEDLNGQTYEFTGYTVHGSDNLDMSDIRTAEEFYAALQLVPENGTITLQADISIEYLGSYFMDGLGGTPNLYCKIDGVTLDLNQHTLTVLENDRFMFTGDGVIVKDGTVNAGANASMSSGYISYVIGVSSGAKDATFENLKVHGGIEVLGNGASLTLNDVTVDATNYHAVYIAGGGSVTVNGGSYDAGVSGSCFCTQTGSDSVTVNSGTTTGTVHGGSGTFTDKRSDGLM